MIYIYIVYIYLVVQKNVIINNCNVVANSAIWVKEGCKKIRIYEETRIIAIKIIATFWQTI